jgi:hypothetical protein
MQCGLNYYDNTAQMYSNLREMANLPQNDLNRSIAQRAIVMHRIQKGIIGFNGLITCIFGFLLVESIANPDFFKNFIIKNQTINIVDFTIVFMFYLLMITFQATAYCKGPRHREVNSV